jgi:ABC-type lipoprotein export system ATPase subunit
VSVNRARGRTLVLVTHDPDLAALADETISLRDGRLAEHRRHVAYPTGQALPAPHETR